MRPIASTFLPVVCRPTPKNLLTTQRAGVLIIEDEANCQQVFARQRITYDCQAEVIERNSTLWGRAGQCLRTAVWRDYPNAASPGGFSNFLA